MAGRLKGVSAIFLLLQSLVARCELSLRKDGKGGWEMSAKGPLAVIGFVIVVTLYHFTS
jgi:hypothetical protein